MKSLSQAVIDALQMSVVAHLTAIETYTGQAAHFSRLGYGKLASRAKDDAEEERGHLAKLLGRIESLDTAPAWTHATPSWTQGSLLDILSANLSIEQMAAGIERDGILTARLAGDEVTAKILAGNLEGSESSITEIEAMQRQIAEMTLPNFLSTQI